MKKMISMLLCLVFVLFVAGCSGTHTENNSSAVESSVTDSQESSMADDEKETEGSSDDQTAAEDADSSADELLLELSEEEIESAKEAAMEYYSDTVFEVNSMEYFKPESDPSAEGDCNFMVNVSKEGVVQEPDRMISLNKTADSWEVVNEGF